MELLRFKKGQKYLIWDFETANLSLLPCSNGLDNLDTIINMPWQLGWQVYDGAKLVENHEDWIWWECFGSKMGRDAAAITQFDQSLYERRAKPPEPILERFNGYLLDPSVISITANGQNFDLYLYNIYRHLLKKGTDYSWVSRHYDIQVLEKASILGVAPPPIGTDDWTLFSFKMSGIRKRGMKTSLAHLAQQNGVPYDPNRHHKEASYDVSLTKGVFDAQIRKMDIYV